MAVDDNDEVGLKHGEEEKIGGGGGGGGGGANQIFNLEIKISTAMRLERVQPDEGRSPESVTRRGEESVKR